ncbi:MAG: phosphate regulon transcriptional regulator PhoB [Porticoccaceae bacterium]|jgi:two-component system phosphate regulon response regulator PhoB|nr:phosphate regulon transcriptional regulator PhoB [Porticoccaceae bacterium]MBT4214213.1 phosphate regulon transcriptional regulator PhoB [Porticoccaceae bacterium]MBT5072036.1 phosphate regulon transcriptional regulator PhoB [Porticoccaceae bacterium]MBT7564043.1 phosphate regulon transcriptional regulator PhoB [Porticoccaceae bacterium]MBT7946446.1 phosphate regulon transcriptional regulator PhoB [Porticoccaceae bacterium]
MPRHTILVVDDETSIREMLVISLESAGYNVLQAENAKTAHSLVLDKHPDLILLDWMMPVTTGLELLRRLKRDEMTDHIPVIMLTAKAEESSKISGLDSGADDYIAKPFSPRELLSRIKAILRRVSREELKNTIVVGGLEFDPLEHRISIAGNLINLAPTEFRLLQFFLTHQERVYSRDQILDYVWGKNVYLDERTVDVHIRRLRKAISVAGHDEYVQTVRGAGYRFSTQLQKA